MLRLTDVDEDFLVKALWLTEISSCFSHSSCRLPGNIAAKTVMRRIAGLFLQS